MTYTAKQLLLKEKAESLVKLREHYQGTMFRWLIQLSLLYGFPHSYVHPSVIHNVLFSVSCLREVDNKQLGMSLYTLLASDILLILAFVPGDLIKQ